MPTMIPEPQCDAAKSTNHRHTAPGAARCKKAGVVRVLGKLVCRQHHTFGWVPWEPPVDLPRVPSDQERRMQRVLSDEA